MAILRTLLISVLVLTGLLYGCTPFVKRPSREINKENLFRTYAEKGRDCEIKGDLVEALKAYGIAVTVDPFAHEIVKSKQRVEAALFRAAEDHYNSGCRFQEEGKYGEARRKFLTALRFRPEHRKAKEILLSHERIRINHYIVHSVREGESISKLAGRYYGDGLKFHIIAKYNNLTDATRIVAGQKIKIPIIDGMQSPAAGQGIEMEESQASIRAFRNWKELEAGEGRDGEEKCRIPAQMPLPEGFTVQIAKYRENGIELFTDEKYHEAVVEFRKILSVNPGHKTALDYCCRSHLKMGRALFDAGDYLGARGHFETSLSYTKDCELSRYYISESEKRYKDVHYKRGMEYYGKEQMVEAVNEWETVRLIDPKYKRVDYLINKANTILKNLEELKIKQ